MRMTRPICSARAVAADARINSFLSAILLTTLLLIAPTARAQQPAAAKTFRLSSIEVTGLQQYTKEQAITASGLQIGQRVDVPALDAAAQRLADSGLFTKLNYRLRTNGDEATVTFEVEEAKGAGVPVVFDNFIWFTDEELMSAVRRELPSFNGTALESAGMVRSITKALEQLLRDKKIEGTVEYTPSADPSGGNAKHVFSVKGANIKICALHFPGARDVGEDVLMGKSKELFENEYSREFVAAYASANLIPVYRERGHLRASFQPPTATVAADAGDCKGVSVTLPVEEGSAYVWDGAQWSGSKSFSTEELESALGMKAKEIANGLKIDEGLKTLHRLYGTKGFLTARVSAEADLDDASRRVVYRINITEGPQYRMGTLTITGLPDTLADYLKEKWELPQGAIYDDSYYKEKFGKVINESVGKAFQEGKLKRGSQPPTIDVTPKLNRNALSVDLTIEFKNISQ